MKYKILLIALMMFAFAKAQSPVSTSPATPVPTDQVTITFNAVGTPLENISEGIRLYSGVTINGMEFQQTPSDFFSNDDADNPPFTKTGANTYSIVLGPSLNEYYSVNAGDIITAIDLVIRADSGSPQTSDYKLTVFEPGLNALITSPNNNSIFQVNENIMITAESSQSADLELSVNGASIKTITGTTISSPYTFATAGNYNINLTAISGNESISDNKSVFVPEATVNESRPSGLKNGVNENADGSITFLLAAPGKTDATLIGSFTGWDLNTDFQMKKDGDYFWITIPANQFTANTEFTYQYLVDYSIKVADPFSRLILDPQNDQFIKDGNFPNLPDYPTGQTTGDVTLYTYQKTPYNWITTNFQRPDNENLVIYELLVRDFSEADSFQAIIDNIDYITNLGVNAVEFMPLNEFEGTDSWGYNPKFHGALDKAYGTPDKFKELVDLLHSKGIAVILDIVYNHAFGQSPLVQLWSDASGFNAGSDNPYLNQTARHPFNVGTDFNHESPWTKQYTKQTMQYFLDEFRIDGFRFDLSKGFTQTDTGGNVAQWGRRDDSRIAILNDYKSFLLANNDNDIYLILEHLSDNDEEKILADNGFMLWGKMTDEYKQNSLGFSSNSNLNRAYFNSRGFNEQHLVSYAESHDEQRIMYDTRQFANLNESPTYNPRSLPVALDRQEAIAAIQYSIPGPKMLWQFGELGYDIPIDENGRTGRKPVPFNNGYSTDSDRQDLYNITSEMIKLKLKYPETFNNTNNVLELNDGLVKRVYLNGPDFDVIVLANFDVVPKSVSPKYTETGEWFDYFDGTSTNVTNQNISITLPAGDYKVLSTQALNTTASVDGDFTQDDPLRMFPNPVSTSFKLNQPIKEVVIYSITGQTIKEFEGSQASYDISNLAPGIYIIDAIDFKDNHSSIKMIKN